MQGINSGNVLTIMADTTPDVRQKDHVSVICRYVDKDVVRERHIELKEVRDKIGAGQPVPAIAPVDSKDIDNK